MRPIDATAFSAKLRKEAECYAKDSTARTFILKCKDWLKSAPTLTLDDIVPRGRWKFYSSRGEDEFEQKCSVCGEYANMRYLYCPNCGAKMDGEEK